MLLLGGVRIELSREQPIFKMGNWLVSHNLEVPPASTKLSQLQDGTRLYMGKEEPWGGMRRYEGWRFIDYQ